MNNDFEVRAMQILKYLDKVVDLHNPVNRKLVIELLKEKLAAEK
jgi:hypothetical protein